MNVEKRAFVAEARARDEEHRALDLEERCRLLEENVWEHLKKQSTDELQERVRRAEERAPFLEESLELLQSDWGAGQTAIEQEQAKNADLVKTIKDLRCDLAAARKEEGNLRLQFQPSINQLNKRLTLLQQIHPALYETIRWMEQGQYEDILRVRGQYNVRIYVYMCLKRSLYKFLFLFFLSS